MGSSHDNNKIRCILYGLPGAGKTLFLYQLKSQQGLLTKRGGSSSDKEFTFCPTLGVNYEEIELNKERIGIFDISGEKNNYGILNFICKAVEISGVIFVMSLNEIDDIEKTKEALELVLGNNYLMKNPKLYLIYNTRNDEYYSWINKRLLDNKLEIDKIKNKYKLKDFYSEIVDVSRIKSTDKPNGLNMLLKSKKDNVSENKYKKNITKIQLKK